MRKALRKTIVLFFSWSVSTYISLSPHNVFWRKIIEYSTFTHISINELNSIHLSLVSIFYPLKIKRGKADIQPENLESFIEKENNISVWFKTMKWRPFLKMTNISWKISSMKYNLLNWTKFACISDGEKQRPSCLFFPHFYRFFRSVLFKKLYEFEKRHFLPRSLVNYELHQDNWLRIMKLRKWEHLFRHITRKIRKICNVK